MRNYLKYELSPYPLSLFTENGLRKNVKSQLFDLFTITEFVPVTENILHVINGGYLLRKVVWQKNDTVEVVIEKYLSFVRNHYASDSCIVFDGYPESESDNSTATSIKTLERMRRKSASNCPTFHLEPHTQMSITQDHFLSNENKIELIKHLSTFESYSVKVAEEDADSLIINSAIDIAKRYRFQNTTTGVPE